MFFESVSRLRFLPGGGTVKEKNGAAPAGRRHPLPLLGGLGGCAAYTAVRTLGGRSVKGPVIVLFFSGFSCLCVVPWLLFDFHPMQPAQRLCLLAAGFSAAGGQFSITAA